jgi:hypothetical protein
MLISIPIPSTATSITLDAFKGSTLLRNVSVSTESKLKQETSFDQTFSALSNMGVTLDMMMQRFDELPLHRFCFEYHPSHDIQSVDNASSEGFNQAINQLPAHGLQQTT